MANQIFFTTTQIRAAMHLDIHLASTAPNARLRKPTPAKEWPHSPLSLDTNQFIGRKFNFNGTMYTVVMIAPSDSFPPDLEKLYLWGRPSNSTKIAGLSLWSGTSMLPIALKPLPYSPPVVRHLFDLEITALSNIFYIIFDFPTDKA